MVRTRRAGPQVGAQRIFVPREPSFLCLPGSRGTSVLCAGTDAAQSLGKVAAVMNPRPSGDSAATTGDMTMDTQVPGSAPPFTAPTSARAGNGLGVAALVLGVASLVAAVSFVLFPLALPGGLLAAILGGIAVSRGRARGATSQGQAIAGIVCGVVALVVAVVFAVRFGTFVANNTSVFTSFDNCIARAGDRTAVSNCIAQFANDVRP
jgi:hypothetical protein